MCIDCSIIAAGEESSSPRAQANALDDPTLILSPVTFANEEAHINGFFAHPQAIERPRAVIITHGNAGLPEDMRNAAAQVAQMGFAGLLLDPTSRTPDLSALSREYLMSYSYIKLLISDIEAAITYLGSRSDIRHDGLGLLGFCGGGVLNTIFAATHPGIRAVVALYAPPYVTPGSNSVSDPRPDMIDFIPQLRTPLQYHAGTADPFIPIDDLDKFEMAVHKHQVDAEIYRYHGAEHGFYHYTYPDEYHPEAAALAQQRMLAFFQKHLTT